MVDSAVMTETDTDEIAPAADAAAEPAPELRARVRDTNIAEETLLATDYLNHFNEIIMLIEMLPDMPDMLEEAQAWTPKGYVEHFHSSACPFRELAIELYPHVPARFRDRFELTIAQLDGLIAHTMRQAEQAIAANDLDRLRARIELALTPMRQLVDVAGSIIHGNEHVLSQHDIDLVIGG